jgi:hypothetical protein
MLRILTLLMCCSIFMDDFYFFRQPFDFYYYYLIYLVFIVYIVFSKQTIRLVPKWFLSFMLILYISSFLTNVAYATLGMHLLKQILGITYSAMAFFLLLIGFLCSAMGPDNRGFSPPGDCHHR